jgi:hypothetical protein
MAKTIDKIIDKVSCKYGAPIGRSNVKPQNYVIVDTGRLFLVNPNTKESKRLFDCRVPMPDGCYDKGGAYWGMGNELRVRYTKDLSYVEFYRKGENDAFNSDIPADAVRMGEL